MFNNTKTLTPLCLTATRTWPGEPIFRHPCGEENLALLGKSKHSAASECQLCFAQVTHPRGVFINLCQNLGNFGWVHVKMKSWKAVVGLWADCAPMLAASVCGKVPYRHVKSLGCEGEGRIWGLGLSQLTRDPALGGISPIMQAVLFTLFSHFWMSVFHFLLCQIMTLSEALLRAINTEISRPSFQWCFYTCCTLQTLRATCLQQQRSRPGSSAKSLSGNDGWRRAGLEMCRSFWHKAASLSSNYYMISINILTSQAKQGGNNSSGWN